MGKHSTAAKPGKDTSATPPAAGIAAPAENERFVVKVGKFTIRFGRIPELLLLISFAIWTTRFLVENLELTYPAALPAGLFLARQLQRLIAWMGESGPENSEKNAKAT
mmetsp:Transcript_11730/g.17687  ORF Transcript_11730/g.17687 Transcript_11730/m.17687 type:complete len:108 (+) Transcript_11730:118-441(+)|eukprot:CAMPEP_0194752556 /NCGR_PEP_ID=MMETSP0323_2-20130528/6387_1 /TAXON_ID=2866 ORGANISM="Crypthecodinium cohnii, Strain Seligo" /NCGR_SAMPLE_ID=MMETSP0323_2 /ASSEMBLY_ACC=CAM_ASM_000346 /LENGTH=107 /DNA_ID=CAMNT_0039669599 /DNA_START=56 /DNA_END=379 /DNA_ORIENTATION=+